MQTVTLPYDPAEDLVDARDQVALLEEAFASGDAKFITVALGAVARARVQLWQDVGLQAVSPDGHRPHCA